MKDSTLKIIFLVSCITAATGLEKCQNYKVPDCKSGRSSLSYHPHESICELYYRCDLGTIAMFTCPAGEQFDPTLRTCEPASTVICNRCNFTQPVDTGGSGDNCGDEGEGSNAGNAKCQVPSQRINKEVATYSHRNKRSLNIVQTSKDICGEIPQCSIEEVGALLPYPPDCSFYIYCDHNETGILSRCPEGLHFNPEMLYCEDPIDANCQPCEISTTTQEPTTTIAICDETPICFAEEIGEVKPYPPDCNMYIYCDQEGSGILSKCPYDLHFSPSLLYCTTPDEAYCPFCEVAPTTLSPEPTTIEACPETPTCGAADIGYRKPYPPDCSMYIYCDDTGNSQLSKCPPEQHFSPLEFYCTSPTDANCPYCEVDSTTVEIITTILICPATPSCSISEVGYNKPYPPDCTMYLYCDEQGSAILSKCPTGLHFSSTESSCTSPEEANCPECQEEITTELSTSTYDPTTTEQFTTIALCPATPTCTIIEKGETKPYPPDCSMYIYCDEFGIEIISKCPLNLHFSPESLSCQSPEEANCPECEVVSTESLPTGTTELLTTVDICPETPKCSIAESGTDKPYPPDCSLYIYCDEFGNNIISQCPLTKHFSPILLYCTLPDDANCPFCQEATTTEIISTTEEITTIGTCPETPICTESDIGQSKPYPPDCSFYIYCDKSEASVITHCPPGLHFSPIDLICTTPSEANCPLCEIYTSTTEVEISTTSATSSDSSTSYSSTTVFVCPPLTTCELEDVWHNKPYPSDCNYYIHCSDIGVAEKRKCPVGKHFDAILESCQLIEIANCRECSPSSSTVAIETSTDDTATSTTIESSSFSVTPSLPPCDEIPTCGVFDVGVMKPYPPDCKKYILCSFESEIIETCPSGQHFSPTEFICTDPNVALCPLCSETTQTTVVVISTTEAVESTSTTEEPTTEEPSTTTEEETTDISTTLSSLLPCAVTPTCSIFDLGVSKPYPPDCTKYILCTFGTPTYETCPAGEHFSPTTFKCMDINSAECPLCSEGAPTTAYSKTSTEVTTEELTTLESTTEELTTETTTMEPTCPPIPTCGIMEVGILKPYPPDCRYFVYCNAGTSEIRRCKVGFEFSVTAYKCVDAASANCVACI